MPDTVNPTSKIEDVGRSGIYPMSGPRPPHDARVVGQGELGHPEQQRQRTQQQWVERGQTGTLSLGRVIFGGFFLYNGMNHFVNRDAMVAYARSKKVPFPELAVLGSGAMLLLGGLSLVSGVRPKLGAALVTTFLTGVSPVMHNFWAIDDEQQQTQELINFTKNAALIGGAAFAASVPEPWGFSPSIPGAEHGLAAPA